MIEETIDVGLAIERRDLGGPWGGVAWRPIAVFAEPPDVAPWTALGHGKDAARFYVGRFPIHLYSTETANYRDNLSSGAPKLWVVMRGVGDSTQIEVSAVTADPAEGEGSTEAGSNLVETIDMPAEVAGVVAAFIDAHHVERPVIKRRRDSRPADVRRRGGPDDGGKN